MDFLAIYQTKIKRLWWLDILLYFSISVLVAVVFCYIIFSAKISMVKKEITDQEAALLTVGTLEQKAQEKTVLAYIKKIADFNSIFTSHKFASNVFSFMQQQTMPAVWFSQFTLNQKTNSVQLTGQARDMDNFSRQVAGFEKNKYVKKLGSVNTTIATNGDINFGTNLSLDPKIFSYSSELAIAQAAKVETETKTETQKQSTSPAKSSQKMITIFDFYLADKQAQGLVNQEKRTISIDVPFGTDISNLSPSIITSPKAKVAPASGIVKNFTSPVAYKVTAEDGSSQNYTATVNILAESSGQSSKPSLALALILIAVMVISILLIAGIFLYKKFNKKPAPQNAN